MYINCKLTLLFRKIFLKARSSEMHWNKEENIWKTFFIDIIRGKTRLIKWNRFILMIKLKIETKLFRFQFYSCNKNYFPSDNLLQKTNFTNKCMLYTSRSLQIIFTIINDKKNHFKNSTDEFIRQIFAKIFMQNNYLSLSYIYILLSCNLSRNLFFLQNYSNIFFFNVTIQIKYECSFNKIYLSILKIFFKDIL